VGRRKGTDMGGVYQGLVSKPHELQPVGEKVAELVHNLAASGAQQTTTSKLVRQNASGMHQNAPFRE